MILGIDPGSARIGLAVADTETRFARPLEVVDVRAGNAIGRIVSLIDELGVETVVVGHPVGLSGRAGPAAEEQGRFVAALAAATEVPVVTYDERLTTVIADQRLRASGASRRDRKGLRDAIAAQVMLQGWLDATA